MYVPSVILPSNEVVLGSILDIVEHVEKIGALTASRKKWTDFVFSHFYFDLESWFCLISSFKMMDELNDVHTKQNTNSRNHTASSFLSWIVNSSLMSSSSQSYLHCLGSILAGTFLLSYAGLKKKYHPLQILRNHLSLLPTVSRLQDPSALIFFSVIIWPEHPWLRLA